MSKEDFGVWSLFLTVTTIVEMSRNGLIQNALIKLLHSHNQEFENKIITASWIINGIYTLVVYGLLLLLSEFALQFLGMYSLKLMFIYFGLSMVFLIPISQFNYLQQARLSFDGVFWTAIVRQGIFFLIVLFIYIFKLPVSVTSLVWIQACCTVAGLVVAYFTARKYMIHRYCWDKDITLKVFTFGKYVMGTNLASLLFKSIDQFSVGYFLNASSVALYSSAIRLSNLIEYPATSVAEVVYPYSTSKIQKDGEQVAKGIYEKSVGITLLITIPIVVITLLFSDWIIYLIAGESYSQSSAILRVTILFGLLTPFNRQFGLLMDSSNRPHLNFALLVFALVINVIMNLIFIHFFGLIGAAYGTLLSYLVISIIGHFILVHYFNVSMHNVLMYMIYYLRQLLRIIKIK